MLKLKLLGLPAILLNDQAVTLKTNKSQALLYYLAISSGFHSRDLLADLLWPHMQTSQARKNLRDALSNLRAYLGDYLLIDRQKLAFNHTLPHQKDVTAFLQKIEHGRATAQPGLIEEGLTYYQDSFLAGLPQLDAPPFEEWRQRQQTNLQQELVEAMSWLAHHYLDQQRYTDGIVIARRILTFEPCQESIHRLLMQFLAYEDNRAGAMHQYELCRQRLASALQVAPSVETDQLYQQIKAGTFPPRSTKRAERLSRFTTDTKAPSEPLPSPGQPLLHNLPALTTNVIGRQQVMAQLQARLLDPAFPLITLVGTGGIGKSVLALAVAHACLAEGQGSNKPIPPATLGPDEAGRWVDGVWFIDLSPLHITNESPAQVEEMIAAAIATGLNIRFDSQATVKQQLALSLRQKALLLILDNFEHLHKGVAYLFELLQVTRSTQLLVTSRQRLGLTSESVIEITGLSVPASDAEQPGGSKQTTEQLLSFGAIELFCTEASATLPDFELNPANMGAIVRICQRVEGLPLGIKLAASLLTTHSCIEIAERLAYDYQFLHSAQGDLPMRQHSMAQVLEQSWQQLPSEDALILARCTQIYGKVDLATLQAVTGATAAQIRHLVRRSLLQLDPITYRFSMHSLIRQFAVKQLSTIPSVAQSAAEQHARYFLNFLAKHEWDFLLDQTQLQLARGMREDLIAAWRWGISTGQLVLLAQAAPALSNLYQLNSRLYEAIHLFSPAITLARQQVSQGADMTANWALAQLLNCCARFYRLLGQVTTAERWATEVLASGQQLGHPILHARALHDLAELATLKADYQSSYSYSLQAIALLQSQEIQCLDQQATGEPIAQSNHGDQHAEPIFDRATALWIRAAALNNIAVVSIMQARVEDSRKSAIAALNCLQLMKEYKAGDDDLEADIRLCLAINYQRCREYMLALTHFKAAQQLNQRHGNRRRQALTACYLGDLYCDLGAYRQARAIYTELFSLEEDDGQPIWLCHLYVSYGRLLHLHGDQTAAHHYYQLSLNAKQTNHPTFYIARARAHFYLGVLFTEWGQWDQAYEAYQAVEEQVLTIQLCHGRADIAAALAMLYAAQQQWQKATAQVELALHDLATNGIATSEDPFLLYQHCTQVLQQQGDLRAIAVRSEAQALIYRYAATIHDPELRNCFLTQQVAITRLLDPALGPSTLGTQSENTFISSFRQHQRPNTFGKYSIKVNSG